MHAPAWFQRVGERREHGRPPPRGHSRALASLDNYVTKSSDQAAAALVLATGQVLLDALLQGLAEPLVAVIDSSKLPWAGSTVCAHESAEPAAHLTRVLDLWLHGRCEAALGFVDAQARREPRVVHEGAAFWGGGGGGGRGGKKGGGGGTRGGKNFFF